MNAPENPLKRGDVKIIEAVLRTNGGGYDSSRIPRAQLKRLLDLGAVRVKPCKAVGDLTTSDEVWASRRATSGYVIHGSNARALLATRQEKAQ